jgi:epimerase transport system membrane fusion protein
MSKNLGNVIEQGVVLAESKTPVAATIRLKKSDTFYRFFGFLVILMTFGLLIGWAGSAPLESAIVSMGNIQVASRNKVVQHIENGKVDKIYIKEGDIVKKGDILLRLDSKALRLQLDGTQAQIWESLASQQRLRAERDDKQLRFSQPLLLAAKKSRSLHDILETQRKIFSLGGSTLSQSGAILTQRKRQAQQQILGNKKMLISLRQRKASLERDLASLRPLDAQRLIPRNELRAKEREHNALLGDISARQSDIKRLKEVMLEQNQQQGLEKKRYFQSLNLELRDLERRHIDLVSTKERIEEKLSHIDIIAPVAGKIEKFDVVTIGAVIQAGSPIVEIVPLDYKFNIIANVSVSDIDNLNIGERAEIRLSIFDDARYFEPLYAHVENISADTTIDKQTGFAFYKTRLNVSKEVAKELEKRKVKLVAGMPVEVVIKTGKRTVLEYFMKPLKQMLDNSLNEK